MKQRATTKAWINLPDGSRIPPMTQVQVLYPPTVRNIQLSKDNLATYTLFIRIAIPQLNYKQAEVPFDQIQLEVQTTIRPH